MTVPANCPFCGEVPNVQHRENTQSGWTNSTIFCDADSCLATAEASGKTYEEALRRWNTRASLIAAAPPVVIGEEKP